MYYLFIYIYLSNTKLSYTRLSLVYPFPFVIYRSTEGICPTGSFRRDSFIVNWGVGLRSSYSTVGSIVDLRLDGSVFLDGYISEVHTGPVDLILSPSFLPYHL